MKLFTDKAANFNKVEFWAATGIFVLIVFFHISDAVGNEWPSKVRYGRGSIPFSYYFIPKLVRYIVLYSAFLVLTFNIVPNLVNKRNLLQNIVFVILIFLVMGLVFGITDTYLKNYLFKNYFSQQEAYNFIFIKSFLYAAWLLLMFGFYSLIKYLGLYLLSRSEAIQNKYKFVTPGGLAAFVLWLLLMFILFIEKPDRGFVAICSIIPPFAIGYYWYSLHFLIPKSLTRKKPFRAYIGRALLVLVISYLPVCLAALILSHQDDAAMAIGFLNVVVQLLIITPFSWFLYKRLMQGSEEVFALKTELGQSNANLDFLRSQINPHFLFNALNTIYGTAIQENAERTSEGIEKLGDMMRFMLQENMQEKISLAREVEYLNNYISLQKLRTDPNPNVSIMVQIEEQLHAIQIAPMLLIPFIENAFKHGISFREPSHIRVTLEVKENTLYFDVYNSKHIRPENDPEKNKSGIGLNNVKQRLQLLYPSKHELIIRETGKEFFVHLTLQLS